MLNELFNFKYKNKKQYFKMLNDLLDKEEFIISTNEDNNFSNPIIIPIQDTAHISIQLFESEEIALKYQAVNPIKLSRIKKNELLILLDALYYKGLSSMLCYLNDESCLFTYIEDVLRNNPLVSETNTRLIKVLNKLLIEKGRFNYVYHKTLTVDEIIYGIVRYNILKEGSKDYIHLFETEDLAEKYLMGKSIKITDDVTYPITTITNAVLYHSLANYKKNIDFIVIHTEKEKIKIDKSDFIKIIVRVGFEQLNLD